MSNELENRRSFRVTESVYVKYEILSDAEMKEGLDRRKVRLGVDHGAQSKLVDIDARLIEALYKLSGESDKLGRCINLLNDKINIAVDQMPGLRKEKSTLAVLPPQTCDVGADGLVFASRVSLALGTNLYVQFMLATDNRYVESFATVVRVTDPPGDNDADLIYGIAIEFVGMKAAQREMLIQHMFNRESETLRMRRLKLDSV